MWQNLGKVLPVQPYVSVQMMQERSVENLVLKIIANNHIR